MLLTTRGGTFQVPDAAWYALHSDASQQLSALYDRPQLWLFEPCPNCHGMGKTILWFNANPKLQVCAECYGSGEAHDNLYRRELEDVHEAISSKPTQ